MLHRVLKFIDTLTCPEQPRRPRMTWWGRRKRKCSPPEDTFSAQSRLCPMTRTCDDKKSFRTVSLSITAEAQQNLLSVVEFDKVFFPVDDSQGAVWCHLADVASLEPPGGEKNKCSSISTY